MSERYREGRGVASVLVEFGGWVVWALVAIMLFAWQSAEYWRGNDGVGASCSRG